MSSEVRLVVKVTYALSILFLKYMLVGWGVRVDGRGDLRWLDVRIVGRVSSVP